MYVPVFASAEFTFIFNNLTKELQKKRGLMKDRAFYNKLAREHEKIWEAEKAEMKAQEAKQPKQN